MTFTKSELAHRPIVTEVVVETEAFELLKLRELAPTLLEPFLVLRLKSIAVGLLIEPDARTKAHLLCSSDCTDGMNRQDLEHNPHIFSCDCEDEGNFRKVFSAYRATVASFTDIPRRGSRPMTWRLQSEALATLEDFFSRLDLDPLEAFLIAQHVSEEVTRVVGRKVSEHIKALR